MQFIDGGEHLKFAKPFIILVAMIALVVFFAFIIHPYPIPRAYTSSVVVYTSVDQIYSEPIFKEFENATGIQVLPVYDVEAAKTTGLVNRLIAERARPQADVFWNNEFVQTMLLKKEGVLAPYKSLESSGIPSHYMDAEGYWTGFGGRARVILANTNLLSTDKYPKSIFDLLDQNYTGNKIGIAYPSFGTTATQAAALYAALGPERARNFYVQLKAKGVRVVDGNSVVRDLVASGQLSAGLTDTDDACGSLRVGAPVVIIVPDQAEGCLGTLIIPNTLALIAGAPHPSEAKALIDFLLRKEVEEKLVKSGFIQIPVRSGGSLSGCISDSNINGMNVSLADIFGSLEIANRDLREIFIS